MSIPCPVCADPLQQRSDWLLFCQNCGLYRSNLEPGPGKAFDGIETLRRQNFEQILDLVEQTMPVKGRRLLEIGSAKGWFLQAAQQRGASVSGVEPVSADAAAARLAGFDIEEGLFPQSPQDRGPYDLIVFNDVFEHLPDPVAAVKACADLLTSDGLLIINIPSSRGPIFRVASLLQVIGVSGPYDRLWQRGLPSPHITYFNPDNLRQLVEGQTDLRRSISHPLPSLHRDGLRQRIESSANGMPSGLVFAAAWALSFVLPLFPSDIELSVYSRATLP